MKCESVTITGADDNTSIDQLVAWSEAYPFAEWGILMSERQQGTARFPSRPWMTEFLAAARRHRMRVSAHLCGRWVRQLLVGELDLSVLPELAMAAQRIQINTHAEVHPFNYGMVETMRKFKCREFIFQWDGVPKNELIAHGAQAGGIPTAILFDTSGGAGESPDSWPMEDMRFHCGYAGGLGPRNIGAEIKRIEAATERPYWIDMERRVRVPDDSALDPVAVVTVLDTVDALRRVAGIVA